MSDDLIRASGLWLKERNGGGKFMSGQVRETIPEGAKLLIFKNDRKENGSNEPDYQLFYVQPEGQPPMQRADPGQRSQPEPPPVDEDDIPF